MATLKTVSINAKLQEGYKVEGMLGDRVLYVDQPKSGGTDAGPTPLEYFLLSLAGCIAIVSRIIANQKKIPFRSIELTIQGYLDLDALLGKMTETRAGFGGIEIKANIDADMSAEEKMEFLHEVDKRCPLSDTIAHGTQISLVLQD